MEVGKIQYSPFRQSLIRDNIQFGFTERNGENKSTEQIRAFLTEHS